MSSVFEILFLFWFLVMSLLSSWYEMDVCAKLLADDVWAAEDDKTSFLSVEVDSFDQLFLKERPISLLMVQISTIKLKYDKLGSERKLNKSKYEIFIYDQNIMFGYNPPMEKLEKSKNFNQLFLMNVQDIFWLAPFYLMNIIYLSKILRALLSNIMEFCIFEKVDNSIATKLRVTLINNRKKLKYF